MFCRGIRGAITLEADTKEEIQKATVELLNKMLEENDVKKEDIAFAIFTTTPDIRSAFPAKFARLDCGFNFVPMTCYHELDVKGGLKLCLRILLTINTIKLQKDIKHIYLKGAADLRKDINKKGY